MWMMQRRCEGIRLEYEADRYQYREEEEEDEVKDEETFADGLHM